MIPRMQEAVERSEHESYQLRRAVAHLAPASLCKLHVVSLLSRQAHLADQLSDAPPSWQLGSASAQLLPPALEAAAAAAHAASLRTLRAAQERDVEHGRRIADCAGALEATTGVPVSASPPRVHGLVQVSCALYGSPLRDSPFK
jgi:hypothetical protein